jgi:hypothetical protein
VLVLAAAATSLGGALAPAPAQADTAQPAAVKTAWYWSLVGVGVQGNALPADPPAETSLVPAGSLGVAYLADEEDAALNTDRADRLSAVAFDVSGVPIGSTYSSFSLTMPLDPTAQQLMSGTPDISACELISGFDDSATPSGAASVPAYSPLSCVKGTFKDTIGTAGGFVFDLTAIANDWSGGAPAEGVLIRPTTGLATPQPPFSISLAGKAAILAAADYTLPAPPDDTSVTEVDVPAVPGLAPPPPLPGTLVPAVVPSVPYPTVPLPQTNPQPVAPPLAEVAYTPGALVPSGAWWLAFLALLGLLGLTAAVLGDPLAPVVVDARRRRFAEVVRTQSRAAVLPQRTARPATRPRPA